MTHPARVRLLPLAVLLLLAGCGGSRPAAAEPTPPPTVIGVNAGKVEAVGAERSFANLVGYARPVMNAGHGWQDVDPAALDADGWPTPGGHAEIIYPLGRPSGDYHCTWEGDGQLSAGSDNGRLISRGAHSLDFSWGPTPRIAWVSVSPQAVAVRRIDCREAGVARDALFLPAYVADIANFRVIRFMDWQRVNDNSDWSWATRTRPATAVQEKPLGVAIEHMMTLATQANADPWLVIPYRADDASVEAMARFVHDRLAPGHRVYVELGNEIWNSAFPAAQQARAEGLAEGLSTDPTEAMLRRYAEKAGRALAIWTRVFADDPKRLVRVVSTFQGLSSTAETVLGFRDTPRFVDALATAPYFEAPLPADESGIDAFFGRLDAAVDAEIGRAAINKAVATKYGKRYIAYEGGQALNSPNLALLTRVERDGRMEEAYARYLAAWKARIGDLLMLYQFAAPISAYGAWGLREETGQPDAAAPKMRAVKHFLHADAAN